MFDAESGGSSETELIARLRALEPAGGARSLEQFWYAAGVSVGRRQMRVWRWAAAVCLVGTLMPWIVPRATPRAATWLARSSPVQAVGPSPDSATASADSYLQIRDRVLREGWQALPPPMPAAESKQIGISQLQ